MTDRELLLENNAKIKAIQEKLNNKILSLNDGETEISIYFNEDMVNNSDIDAANDVYSFKVDDDTILFSFYTYQKNTGLWKYKISTKEITQIYSQSQSFQYFQTMGDYCIISGGVNTQGILLYNIKEGTCELAYSNKGGQTNFTHYHIIENDCLIGNRGYGDVLLYDGTNHTITMLYDGGLEWSNFYDIGQYCLIGAGGNGSGILCYDKTTKTISSTKLWEDGNGWSKFVEIDGGCLIAGSYSATGILLYDLASNTISSIYDKGVYWNIWNETPSGYLIASNAGRTDTYDILFYNKSSRTIQSLYYDETKKYYWNVFLKVGDNYLISSSNSSNVGILRYKESTKTIDKIYETGYNWAMYGTTAKGCLFNNNNTSFAGLYYYNLEEDNITKVQETGCRYTNFHTIGNFCLFTSEYNNGLYCFNEIEKIVLKLHQYGVWNIFKDVIDGCLLSSTAYTSSGIYLFDVTSNSLQQLTSKSYGYDIFELDKDNNYYIKCSILDDKRKYIFYYNQIEKTLKFIGYRLEVR